MRIVIQIFKWWQIRESDNAILLFKWNIIRTTSPQNSIEIDTDNKKEWVVSIMYVCFLLTIPFCSRVLIEDMWWIAPCEVINEMH